MPNDSLFRIPPYYYIHILDQNTNVTRLEVGPSSYVCKNNERVIFGPTAMIIIPPRHYCNIKNPVRRNAEGSILVDKTGQIKLSHADQEIRLAQEPFPLYPGEVMKGAVTMLKVVLANTALRLQCVLDFTDAEGTDRIAGDEWLYRDPGIYIPQKEVIVVETVKAVAINPNQAIKLRARKQCTDHQGNKRYTGEEWLVKETGAYLPGAYEEVVVIVNAYILSETTALHLKAVNSFKDDYGVDRTTGEDWLIKLSDTGSHIPGVYETVVKVVTITTLTNRQYAIILDPVDTDGHTQFGRKKLVKGPASFFLMPGESLESGIQNVFVLGEDEGLILRAIESLKDGHINRQPGDRWMIRGPAEYVPPIAVEVVDVTTAIPLDENEGIYVRNIKNGKVRVVSGQTYMLTQDEELWGKELPDAVEKLLTEGTYHMADIRKQLATKQHKSFSDSNMKSQKKSISATGRDKTKVVTYRVPHNAAVQIYDYKEKKARVKFGPDLIMLGPDEQFTQLSLSGGKPKRPFMIRSLCLLLGPDFCTDIITVETADHARLSLQLSYNWYFDIASNVDEAEKIFSIPDFIGDACKAIASRVRGTVASVKFDDFHKNSAKIIRTSVFGVDDNRKVKDCFRFDDNNLVVTSIDIQSVEPVDQRTRESLMKSVQMAIEITTSSQEATARHEAERLEQEAKGKLERQRISNESEAERSRCVLLELQASSAAVESKGQAIAEALSKAESARIEGEAAVNQAKLKAEAMKIEAESELETLNQARGAEITFLKQQMSIEINKSHSMAEIEVKKFKQTVDAIGSETIRAIAAAGPENQVKLLKSLGIKSTLITDGNCPINLFNTARGLVK